MSVKISKILRTISIIAVYSFIIAMLPVNFITPKVLAVDSDYTIYNSSNTAIGNKYNITGKILKVVQYDDCSVVLTKDTVYIIKDGQVQTKNIGQIYPSTDVERVNNYIYIAPYYNNGYYKLGSINTTDVNDFSEGNVDNYVPVNNYYSLQEAKVDSNGNKWFSVYQNDTCAYRLIRINSLGSAQEMAKIDYNSRFNYDDAITDVSFDSSNVWFKVTKRDSSHDSSDYMLGKVSQDGSSKEKIQLFHFDDCIKQYKAANDGDFWVIVGKQVIHDDKDGNVLKTYQADNPKSIDIDGSGNVWLLDGNTIFELSTDKTGFTSTNTISKDIYSMSTGGYGKIGLIGTKGLEFIQGSNVEKDYNDNHIKHLPIAVQDNKSDVNILSESNDNATTGGALSINVTKKNNAGDLSTDIAYSSAGGNPELTSAKSYNGDIYIPFYNTIYKVNRVNSSLDDCYDVFPYSYIQNSKPTFKDMQFDADGNIYVLYDTCVYKLSISNGQVNSKSVYYISSLKANPKNTDIQEVFDKLIKDKSGNVYAVAKVSGDQRYNYDALIKLNDFSSIGETPINNMFDAGIYPEDVFLNENDDLEYVYYVNNGYRVYTAQSDGGKLPDTRFDNQDQDLMDNYNHIQGVKKTYDNKTVLCVAGKGIYTMGNGNSQFSIWQTSDISSPYTVNSMAQDANKGIYVTIGDDTVVYFKGGYYTEDSYSMYVPKNNTVSPKKAWTVNFNKLIDTNTVITTNVFVKDSSGNNIPVKVSCGSDGKSITVTPTGNYAAGETYKLYIQDIKDRSESPMNMPVKMEFTILK